MIDRNLNYGRHLIERFLQDVMPLGSVLDIGAGRGSDLNLARSAFPTCQLHAIECFPPYIEELKQQSIDVHSINIERDRFPFSPESLDVVMGNQILEHTKEVFWIFDQVSTVLKVGGYFIIGVPNLAALHNRILLALGRQPSPIKNNSAHLRGYTKQDLMALANSGFKGGYELVDFGGSNFYPFPPALAQPLAALLPSMAYGIFLKLKKTRVYRGEFLEYPVKEQLETNFFVGQPV